MDQNKENMEVVEFLVQLAFLLFKGDIIENDIYEAMLEVNNNDHSAATVAMNSAIEIANSYRMTFIGYTPMDIS